MTAAIDPGKFRTRLELQVENREPDGCGGFTTVWRRRAELWGRIRPLTASAGEWAGNRIATTTHEVSIRANDLVEAGARFSTGGRILDIEAIFDPDESGRYLVCRAVERR